MVIRLLLAILLINLIDLAISVPVQNAPAYQRFVQIPVDHNRTVLADLEAKPQLELLRSIQKFGDVNKYLLYTRANPNLPQRLSIDSADSIRSSNFNPYVPTAILVHGWQSQPSYGLGPTVRTAYLDNQNVNVIVLDWRRVSSLDYVTAVAGVPNIGRNLGLFLDYLSSVTGAPLSSMHLIGHSLGAHVAANAGRLLNGQVARLTGLDPAGPSWYLNPNRLRDSDAVYVEAIHTNGAGLGIETSIADVDFYPNGGTFQPGCVSPVCHHGRSYELFAASLAFPNHLVGKKCSNLIQMEFNLCRGSELPLGNNDLRKTGRGIYRLNTGPRYPF